MANTTIHTHSSFLIHEYKNGYDYYIVSGDEINNLIPIAFIILKDGQVKELSIEYFPNTVEKEELIQNVEQRIDNLKTNKLGELYFKLEQLIINNNYNLSKKEK